eukprot:1756910-Rhodomonas_salina.1
MRKDANLHGVALCLEHFDHLGDLPQLVALDPHRLQSACQHVDLHLRRSPSMSAFPSKMLLFSLEIEPSCGELQSEPPKSVPRPAKLGGASIISCTALQPA